MEITFEAPISVEDVEVAEGQLVALRREKFGALVEYVERLEGTLKCTDFEFQQERHFVSFLLDALGDSLRFIDRSGNSHACRELTWLWREHVYRLYHEGLVRRQSADDIQRLTEIIEEADSESSAGHGQS